MLGLPRADHRFIRMAAVIMGKTDRLQDKQILIAWGTKDIGFRKKELNRWICAFPHATVVRFSDAGHLVAEEKPDELIREMRNLTGAA
jgi:pimeloyl-ACP methyl ester carboxylesterase